jgi:hypothetical protein
MLAAGKRSGFRGLSLSGADASNYSLSAHAAATASITAKALSVSAPIISDKIYDGTSSAGSVTLGDLSGFVGNETGYSHGQRF